MTISQTEGALLVGTTGTGKTVIAETPGQISSAKLAWITPSNRRIHAFGQPP